MAIAVVAYLRALTMTRLSYLPTRLAHPPLFCFCAPLRQHARNHDRRPGRHHSGIHQGPGADVARRIYRFPLLPYFFFASSFGLLFQPQPSHGNAHNGTYLFLHDLRLTILFSEQFFRRSRGGWNASRAGVEERERKGRDWIKKKVKHHIRATRSTSSLRHRRPSCSKRG